MVLGKVVKLALKQANDSCGGVRYYLFSANGAAVAPRARGWFHSLAILFHDQLNSLSILDVNRGEGFKNAIFVKSFDGLCHG